MKKIIVLLSLIIATPVIANPFLQIMSSGVASSGTSYLLDEGFEGSGLPTDWAQSGSGIDFDYATSPAPLSGSESMLLSVDFDMVTSPAFTGQSTVYVKMIFRMPDTAYTSTAIWIDLLDTSLATLADLKIQSNLRPVLDHGTSVAYGSSGSEFVVATTYYIWIDYVAGSGTDGELYIYHSTTDSKPGTPAVSLTNGTSTGNVTNIRFWRRYQNNIFDDVKVSSTVIP